MNINVASQNQGVVAWTGLGAPNNPAIDIRHHVHFGFTFQVDTDIAADAVFEVQAAAPSDADPCAPGQFDPVEETITCMAPWGTVPSPQSKVTIPAGTKAGTICTGTLPCKPNAFIKVMPVSGDTGRVQVVAVLGGPR